MARLDVEGSVLRVTLTGLDAVLALKRTVTVPLESITGIEQLPHGVGGWVGWRLPGAFVPGVYRAGTYFRHGRRSFYAASRWRPALRITLRDASYDEIVLSVDDPEEATLGAWPSAT